MGTAVSGTSLDTRDRDAETYEEEYTDDEVPLRWDACVQCEPPPDPLASLKLPDFAEWARRFDNQDQSVASMISLVGEVRTHVNEVFFAFVETCVIS